VITCVDSDADVVDNDDNDDDDDDDDEDDEIDATSVLRVSETKLDALCR
jgi:hypothetical protein